MSKEEEEGGETLKIEGPFGIAAKVKSGKDSTILIALMLCLAVAGILAVLYLHDKKMEEHFTKTQEQNEEQTFVLTLSEAERKSLRLQMPPSLRRKSRGYYYQPEPNDGR